MYVKKVMNCPNPFSLFTLFFFGINIGMIIGLIWHN